MPASISISGHIASDFASRIAERSWGEDRRQAPNARKAVSRARKITTHSVEPLVLIARTVIATWIAARTMADGESRTRYRSRKARCHNGTRASVEQCRRPQKVGMSALNIEVWSSSTKANRLARSTTCATGLRQYCTRKTAELNDRTVKNR